jgi:hypothetical protein
MQEIFLYCSVNSGMQQPLYTHSCHCVLIVTKQERRSQSLLHIDGTEYLWCTVLSQSLSTNVFIEILGHVAMTNIIYVICIYNLFSVQVF